MVLIVPSVWYFYEVFPTTEAVSQKSCVCVCFWGDVERKRKPLVAQTLTKPAEVSKPAGVHRWK